MNISPLWRLHLTGASCSCVAVNSPWTSKVAGRDRQRSPWLGINVELQWTYFCCFDYNETAAYFGNSIEQALCPGSKKS